MPVSVIILVTKNCHERIFVLYLLLKMYFPDGKFTPSKELFVKLAANLNYKSSASIQSLYKKLIEKKWVVENQKTGFVIIRSFSIFESELNSVSRLGYEIHFDELKKFRAVTGAVVFGYLHRLFWRNLFKKKSVQIKGCTYDLPKGKFRFYLDRKVPIALSGVQKILGISIKKASEIKHFALKYNYLDIDKNLQPTKYSIDEINSFQKYYDQQIPFKFIKKKIFVQGINLISINFQFTFCRNFLKR